MRGSHLTFVQKHSFMKCHETIKPHTLWLQFVKLVIKPLAASGSRLLSNDFCDLQPYLSSLNQGSASGLAFRIKWLALCYRISIQTRIHDSAEDDEQNIDIWPTEICMRGSHCKLQMLKIGGDWKRSCSRCWLHEGARLGVLEVGRIPQMVILIQP
jgi:hypothetical protein